MNSLFGPLLDVSLTVELPGAGAPVRRPTRTLLSLPPTLHGTGSPGGRFRLLRRSAEVPRMTWDRSRPTGRHDAGLPVPRTGEQGCRPSQPVGQAQPDRRLLGTSVAWPWDREGPSTCVLAGFVRVRSPRPPRSVTYPVIAQDGPGVIGVGRGMIRADGPAHGPTAGAWGSWRPYLIGRRPHTKHVAIPPPASGIEARPEAVPKGPQRSVVAQSPTPNGGDARSVISGRRIQGRTWGRMANRRAQEAGRAGHCVIAIMARTSRPRPTSPIASAVMSGRQRRRDVSADGVAPLRHLSLRATGDRRSVPSPGRGWGPEPEAVWRSRPGAPDATPTVASVRRSVRPFGRLLPPMGPRPSSHRPTCSPSTWSSPSPDAVRSGATPPPTGEGRRGWGMGACPTAPTGPGSA